MHASPPYRWQCCQAMLYLSLILLSWITPGGGQDNCHIRFDQLQQSPQHAQSKLAAASGAAVSDESSNAMSAASVAVVTVSPAIQLDLDTKEDSAIIDWFYNPKPLIDTPAINDSLYKYWVLTLPVMSNLY